MMIPTNERLIVALDVPTVPVARDLTRQLGTTVNFYKVGLELLMDPGCHDFIETLAVTHKKKIFVDYKFFDVPNTVASAVHQIQGRPVEFITVHGNDEILEAACMESHTTKILAVTALTSLDEYDMEDLGFEVSISDLVLSRAKRALKIGCDGVISSGLEIKRLREEVDDKLIVVVPGIRQGWSSTDDQKRITTVEGAFENGADYIVVGRAIVASETPAIIADQIQREIAALDLCGFSPSWEPTPPEGSMIPNT